MNNIFACQSACCTKLHLAKYSMVGQSIVYEKIIRWFYIFLCYIFDFYYNKYKHAASGV